MKLSFGRLLGASVALLVASGSGVRASEDTPQSALQQEDFDPSSRTNLRRAEGTLNIIVVLKDDDESRARHLNQGKRPEIAAANKAKAAAVAQGLGVQATFTYGSATYGFSAKGVTPAQKKAIEESEFVDYVEDDQIVQLDDMEMEGPAPPPKRRLKGQERRLAAPQGKGPGANKGPPGSGGGGGGGQTTPWGITRVGGAGNGSGKRAWIIDSGIQLDHPDLNVNAGLSKSFLGGKDANDPDDANGHGTHVAGTVAALNNDFGVVGVAAGAEVVSVRVLDRRGSGYLSGVIAGVDYVGEKCAQGDAANMSLGGGTSTTLDNAVITASGSCPFAIAAGNSSTHASTTSPARANGPNIYTVSSMTSSDRLSSFSNHGNPPIDFAAPGSSIFSTWTGSGYNTISGTSMAAPHVCGVLLLGNVGTDGNLVYDRDGNADPIASHL